MSDFKGRHFRGEIVLWAVALVNVRLTLTWIAGESPAGGKV